MQSVSVEVCCIWVVQLVHGSLEVVSLRCQIVNLNANKMFRNGIANSVLRAALRFLKLRSLSRIMREYVNLRGMMKTAVIQRDVFYTQYIRVKAQ